MADTGTFIDSSSNAKASDNVYFQKPYVAAPRLPVALTMLDISKDADITISAKVDNVTKDRFTIHTDSWGDTKRYNTGASWIELAPYNFEYQNGEILFTPNGEAEMTSAIKFSDQFPTPPAVEVFLNALEMGKENAWHVLANATDVTTTGFNLNLKSWADTDLEHARVAWVALPADRPNVFGKNAGTEYKLSTRQSSGTVSFGSTFSKIPRVFFGLKSISLGNDGDLKINVYVDNVTQTGFKWHLEAMEGGGTFYSAALSFICFV